MKLAKRKSQKRLILEFMQRGHELCHRDADLLFGCMRLASRRDELREEGHRIETKMVTLTGSGKRIAFYRLEADDAKNS